MMGSASTILLVEDSDATRQATKALLEAAGYRVACAANGREALDRLRQGDLPAVILLDLAMPVMDGWQFRLRQRQDPALAPIPVVLLSGENNLAEIAASLGVAGFITKPAELGGLLDGIRVLADDRSPALPAGWPLQPEAAACLAGATA